MSKSGAYVAPNARKKEPVTSLNTESVKEFPGLKVANEVVKKAPSISFASLLIKKAEEEKVQVQAPDNRNLKYRMRVIDMPDKPDEDDEYMKHIHVPDLSKLIAARAIRKRKEELERRRRLFESSSSEGEPQEEDISDDFGSDHEDDLQEQDDAYDPSEFDRHR